ncbi:hypothetical protein AUQ48_06765 [Kocuria flava]|uniref:TVP38/TMEM64 family membrane protein n=1 Tax=Kocuria flava TaxID=446860 RepID=A0A2N4T195_9MICC|nr:hypothetical protein AUQ48_06765 [Kocuria flava]
MTTVSTEPGRGPERPGARPAWVPALKGGALLLVIGLAVWYLIGWTPPTVEQIHAFVARFGVWGPLVFGLVFALVAATPVPVTIMAVSGGFLFGMAQGSVLGVVATTTGAWLGYWLARFLGRDALYRLAGPRVEAVEARLRGKGFLTVLVLRPVLPNWTLSYGSGLVRIPQRDYLGATLLGGTPGQLSFAAVGAFTSRPSWPALAVVAASWAAVVVVGVVAWRHARRAEHRAEPEGGEDPAGHDGPGGAGDPEGPGDEGRPRAG